MASRHRARERALQILFQIDLTGDEPADVFAQFAERDVPGERTAADERTREFAERLVRGVLAHRAALDERMESAARRWRVARMPVVDRNVLRLALHEMLHDVDVPAAVAIDEAVELAKRFGGPDSGAFVNGLLDAIRRQADLDGATPGPPREEDPIRR